MDRDIADLQARVKMLEEYTLRRDAKLDEEVKFLNKEFSELKTIVVTAVATAKVKWAILFRVAALVGVVAAIVAALVKFVMMK